MYTADHYQNKTILQKLACLFVINGAPAQKGIQWLDEKQGFHLG